MSSGFIKYQHIERYGTDFVQGIEVGTTYVFPKIDGSNGSLWMEDSEVKAGGGDRPLSIEKDNQGFLEWVLKQGEIKSFFDHNPTLRLFGEWLVPHTIEDYRSDAWNKFYIFDVCIDKGDGSLNYVPYERYKKLLDTWKFDYVPPIAIFKNATYEGFIKKLSAANFLMEDGKGSGEGIVIKNYDYTNQFGRQIWAKIVTSEFQEAHTKKNGCPFS